MPIQINHRIAGVVESLTLALTAKANELKAKGVDVVGFGAGEPDFDTPEPIRKAAIAAIEKGVTRYTASSGTPELRKAICEKLKNENGLEYSPAEVVVSCGAKHTLYNVFMTLLEEGDEVIVPAPYWLSYPEQIAMAGGKTVEVKCGADADFKISPERLEAAITPRTRAFLMNSPSNPTGMVYTPDEIRALAAVLERHPDVAIVSDEIYERLVYGGATALSIAAVSPAMKERTIVVNGMSKTYAMTGWRIGYCAGPRDFIDAVGRMQSHATSNPTSFCQTASIAALKEAEPDVLKMRAAFDERRKDLLARVRALPGVVCPEPLGAFYVFPDVSALYPKVGAKGSLDFCAKLLEEAQVSLVPGFPFGEDRCVRLSYAISPASIVKGMERFAAWVAKFA